MGDDVGTLDQLRRAAESFGDLVSVVGAVEGPVVGDFDEFTFTFERGTLSVRADGEFDTVVIDEGGPSLPTTEDLSTLEPWATVIGCGLLWLWTLRNQRGFVDGFQAEFADGAGRRATVQLMCSASALAVCVVVGTGSLRR
jgi:hypothetical protein